MRQKRNVKMLLILIFIIITSVANVSAQNVQWKKHLGDPGVYRSVAATSDGIVAVGNVGNIGLNGGTATIVKYNNNGDILWKKSFGNVSDNVYESVTTVTDGMIVVGNGKSFGTGEWAGITGKGGKDAIIIKYNNDGEIIWKKNFGGNGSDYYNSVITVPDGIIAIGNSNGTATDNGGSFGNGDWEGITGKGGVDAIIVKYNNNGEVVWKKNFGGNGWDQYNSITAVSDGVIVVGYSGNNPTFGNSFGTGDWEDVTGKGGNDAIIVKYDNDGNVIWKKHFGGEEGDYYNSVAAVAGGIVAAGYSSGGFGTGDWEGIAGKGISDAIIVKYDNNGDMLWKNNFGGNNDDVYKCVTTASDGIIAVGQSAYYSFDNGDWEGVTAKGNNDAIIVKYDNDGNPVWKRSFGDLLADGFNTVMVVSGEIITAGVSYLDPNGSVNTGDWAGISGNGSEAIIVKYTEGSTGISQISETPDIKIYPNPSGNNFYVECEKLRTIKLYDMSGREILSQNTSDDNTEINISHLPEGIYNVIVFSEDKVIGKSKIVKQ